MVLWAARETMTPGSAEPALCLTVCDGPLRFIRRRDNTRRLISVNSEIATPTRVQVLLIKLQEQRDGARHLCRFSAILQRSRFIRASHTFVR